MQEAIVEEQESRKEENIHLTRFLRVLANFLALCTLAGSGYLIFFVVRRSQQFALEGLENYGWWERNEVRAISIIDVLWNCVILLCMLPFSSSNLNILSVGGKWLTEELLMCLCFLLHQISSLLLSDIP